MAWLNGVGTGPDRTKAMLWLERAAGQDEIAAQLQLAQLHAERTAEAPEVRQWLRRAASLCSGTGQYLDRKSTRLNSSHVRISYAVFCLKKKKKLNPFSLLHYYYTY